MLFKINDNCIETMISKMIQDSSSNYKTPKRSDKLDIEPLFWESRPLDELNKQYVEEIAQSRRSKEASKDKEKTKWCSFSWWGF